MITKLSGINISDIACALPKQVIGVSEYLGDIATEKDKKRLIRGTGFKHLRICPREMTTSDLCENAARKIIRSKPELIDALIFVTQTPDYYLPATSHILQYKLGLKKSTLCIDINEGCSGYVHGLYLASLLVSTRQCKEVLLLCGDTISKLTSPFDRATRGIFGDAGTATLVTNGTDEVFFHFDSFGQGSKFIQIPNSRHRIVTLSGGKEISLHMDGMSIMEFALSEVPKNISKLLAWKDLTVEDIDLFALHQANKLILSSLALSLNITNKKLPFVAENIGNTSSGSIPIVLYTEQKQNMEKVVCCGFGVGLSIGSCITDFSKTNFEDMIEI